MDSIKSEYGLISPNASNPRKIAPDAFEKLKQSIARDPEFMRLRPIIIDREGTVLGGNQRLSACIALGMTELQAGWVIRAEDITPEQARRFVLVDNAPEGMSGEWDVEMLARDYGFEELDGLGFDLDDLRAFDDIGNISQDEAPDIDAGEPASRRGAVYILGDHRLVCGDALSAVDVDLLTEHNRASMCFTDPPYNVAYDGLAGTIANDDMSPQAFAEFLRAAMARIVDSTSGGIYVCMSTKEMPAAREAFRLAGGKWSCDIVWVKDRFVIGHGDYQQQYEAIMYGWPAGRGPHFFTCDRNEPNVWEDVTAVQTVEENGATLIRFMGFEVAVKGRVSGTVRRQKAKTDLWRFDKPRRSADHPTMKPVALVANAVRNSSRRGERVLDLFGGSGTTLMACEQLGRKCLMMEIDPRFCDVIRKRWWIGKHGSYEGWAKGTAE